MQGQPHYLELVTPDVAGNCAVYERAVGAQFSEPDALLGDARVARLPGGSLLGIRAPLRSNEEPVCRIYLRVDDLAAATEAAREAGGRVAVDSMALGDYGRISIVLRGGIEQGYWQTS